MIDSGYGIAKILVMPYFLLKYYYIYLYCIYQKFYKIGG